MLKPLTLSLSLAVALGFCSVSMAGGHGNDGCSTCGLASPQGGPIASAQGPTSRPVATRGDTCGRKKCNLFSDLGGKLDGLHCKLKALCHPPVTYEWVLKKKRLWGHHGGGCDDGCEAPALSRLPDQPGRSVGPGWLCRSVRPGRLRPRPARATAPPARATPAPIYGAGQHAYRAAKPAPTIASVPAEMTPAFAGEEAPPAPEVKTSGGLLLPTPSGN